MVPLAVPRATPFRLDPAWRAVWRGTYSPAPIAVGGRASPYHQSAKATSCRRLLFWEDDLQCLDDQLHPGVLLDRQQGDNFRTSSDHDGDSSNGSGIHGQQDGGRTSSLETRCSTVFSLEKNSLRSSLMSV